MGQFSYLISGSDTLNEVPPGFTVMDGGDWTVQEQAWAANGRAGRIGWGSSNSYRALASPFTPLAEPDDENPLDFRLRFRRTGAGSSTEARVCAVNNNIRGYMVGYRNEQIAIQQRTNTFSTHASATFMVAQDKTYIIRYQTLGDPDWDRHRMKIWSPEDEDEPEAWNLDTAGHGGFSEYRDNLGLVCFTANQNAAPYWDYFALGTAGDPAPAEPDEPPAAPRRRPLIWVPF